MTQGRQSKRGKIALGLIGALLCAVMVAPASALAAGDCEYCVDIPGGDGSGQDPTANASGGSGGSGGDSSSDSTDTGTVTTPTTTDSGTTATPSEDSDQSGGAGNAGGGKGGDGQDQALSGKGGDRHQDSLAPADDARGAVTSSDSDDGGFPVILVAIAVLAAAGVGFAAWRARRGDGMGRPAETGHSA